MLRWTAPSDRDYDDEISGRFLGRDDATLHCVRCDRAVIVDADHPGPVWCDGCLAADDARPGRVQGAA
jgi:hypothetical protein